MIIRFLFVAFLSLVSVNTAFATDESFCTYSNGVITDDPRDTDDYHYCFPNFQSARVKYHDILACPSEPSLTNYQSICVPLFTSSTGQLVDLNANEQFALPNSGPISISTGTYTHVVMVIEGTLYHKFSVVFDDDRRGINNSGRYCWTTSGASWKFGFNFARSNVECGDEDDVNAQYSTEALFKCQGGNLQTSNDWAWNNGNTRYSSSGLYQSDKKTLIPGHGTSCPSTAPDVAYSVNMQKLATPLVITPTTSTIDFSFNPSGAGLIKLLSPGRGDCPSGGDPCVVTLRSRAPEFVITAK